MSDCLKETYISYIANVYGINIADKVEEQWDDTIKDCDVNDPGDVSQKFMKLVARLYKDLQEGERCPIPKSFISICEKFRFDQIVHLPDKDGGINILAVYGTPYLLLIGLTLNCLVDQRECDLFRLETFDHAEYDVKMLEWIKKNSVGDSDNVAVETLFSITEIDGKE